MTNAFFVPTTESGEELRIWVFYFFVFHAKSGTTNNHRIGSRDITLKPFVILTIFKNFQEFPVSRKTGLKFLIFRLSSEKSEREKRARRLISFFNQEKLPQTIGMVRVIYHIKAPFNPDSNDIKNNFKKRHI